MGYPVPICRYLLVGTKYLLVAVVLLVVGRAVPTTVSRDIAVVHVNMRVHMYIQGRTQPAILSLSSTS